MCYMTVELFSCDLLQTQMKDRFVNNLQPYAKRYSIQRHETGGPVVTFLRSIISHFRMGNISLISLKMSTPALLITHFDQWSCRDGLYRVDEREYNVSLNTRTWPLGIGPQSEFLQVGLQ